MPPFRVDGGRAVACAGGPQHEGLSDGLARRDAEGEVGRLPPPVLVAAVQEIEHDGLGDDGDGARPDPKAAPLFRQDGHHAAGRIKPEGRPTAEHDGVDLLDRHLGLEQGRVAHARPAAMYGDRRYTRAVEDCDADACGVTLRVRLPDPKSTNVCDEVLHSSTYC